MTRQIKTWIAMVVVIFIFTGFLPNLWKAPHFRFTVPIPVGNPSHRLPPGQYAVKHYVWYCAWLYTTVSADGSIVDWHFSIYPFIDDRHPIA